MKHVINLPTSPIYKEKRMNVHDDTIKIVQLKSITITKSVSNNFIALCGNQCVHRL